MVECALAREDALDRAHAIAFVELCAISPSAPDNQIAAPLVTRGDRVVAAIPVEPISSAAADHAVAPTVPTDQVLAAAAFVEFVLSKDGKTILTSFGFLSP